MTGNSPAMYQINGNSHDRDASWFYAIVGKSIISLSKMFIVFVSESYVASLSYHLRTQSSIFFYVRYVVSSPLWRMVGVGNSGFSLLRLSEFAQISESFQFKWQTFGRHLSHLPKVLT